MLNNPFFLPFYVQVLSFRLLQRLITVTKLLVFGKLFGFLVSETSVRDPFRDFKQASSFSRLVKLKEPFRSRQMTYVMCVTIKEVNVKFSSKQ